MFFFAVFIGHLCSSQMRCQNNSWHLLTLVMLYLTNNIKYYLVSLQPKKFFLQINPFLSKSRYIGAVGFPLSRRADISASYSSVFIFVLITWLSLGTCSTILEFISDDINVMKQCISTTQTCSNQYQFGKSSNSTILSNSTSLTS